jgi:hypothetical protein
LKHELIRQQDAAHGRQGGEREGVAGEPFPACRWGRGWEKGFQHRENCE